MEYLSCIVERITYQNPENGYSVIKCNSKGYNDLVTAVERNTRLKERIRKAANYNVEEMRK